MRWDGSTLAPCRIIGDKSHKEMHLSCRRVRLRVALAMLHRDSQPELGMGHCCEKLARLHADGLWAAGNKWRRGADWHLRWQHICSIDCEHDTGVALFGDGDVSAGRLLGRSHLSSHLLPKWLCDVATVVRLPNQGFLAAGEDEGVKLLAQSTRNLTFTTGQGVHATQGGITRRGDAFTI